MKNLISALFASMLLSGCIYSNIRFPMDRDVWQTKLGSKVGTASNHTVLWLFSWGDAGTKAAADNGGITTIEHLDMGVQSYLFGLYSRTDTIAYGN